MDILIILLVVALALAPLTNFLPSKRQREIARLREYAAVHGLFVEFRNLPGSDKTLTGEPRRPEQIIYYGKRLPPSRGEPRMRRAWLADDGGWSGVGHRSPPPDCSGLLPPNILALSQEEASCGVYWKESGGEEEVQQIVEALGAWSAAAQPPG
jgi:hypothetical protein